MDRRSWFKLLIGGGTAAVVGVLGIPAVLTALSPVVQRRNGPVWRAVGREEEFGIGEVTKAVVRVPHEEAWLRGPEEKAVYVYRPSADEIIVFSRNCTDVSCPVTYNPGARWFFCPCHGGIFSQDGEPMAGPPSRGLYRFVNRVRDGVLEIDLNSVPPMG